MNHTYRLVWSDITQAWVAVAEFAKSRGKRSGVVLAAALLASPAAQALDVNALPTGGSITAGSGSIATAGNQMTITQNSQRMVANWAGYNIGQNAEVNYIQPNASSIALNRIAATSPSQILGSLKANGQVWLLNSAGIIFGKSAQVDVGGLVASSLNISNEDFLAGKSTFSDVGGAGSVINQGHLNGKVIALVGPTVENSGDISATGGAAVLASGDKVSLDFVGDGLIGVTVDKGALNAKAENSGRIEADGGLVVLSAKSADALTESAINNTGIIQAKTLANQGGKIVLLGDMQSGTVNVGGTLDASAPNGGDGGNIETSAAHVHVADDVKVTTLAANGANGSWLIDPVDFTIAASGGDMTGAALSTALAGGNVTIQSTSGATGTAGDVNVNDTVSWSANLLTLNALNNININTQMNGSGTAGLALEYGQGAVASGNTSTYNVHAPVNLSSTGSFSTKLGSDGATTNYTIIDSLGAAGSTTGTDLQGMNGNLSGHYVLGANIDAAATATWNPDGSGGYYGFAPVSGGYSGLFTSAGFTGVFDGLGHTISNLTINRSAYYVALFGYATSSSFANIALTNVNIQGDQMVGGLIGQASGGSITNAYVQGQVKGAQHVGGLIGGATPASLTANAENVVLAHDSADVNVDALGAASGTGRVQNIGGLVGGCLGCTITDSYSTGDVTLDANQTGTVIDYFGGLIGQGTGTVNRSYATGNVTAPGGHDVGGLIGYWYGSSNSSDDNLFASGNVVGGSNVGGLLGEVKSTGSTDFDYIYATGDVTGTENHNVGGLVGYLESTSMLDGYATGKVAGSDPTISGLIGSKGGYYVSLDGLVWNIETSGQTSGTGGRGGTTAQMKSYEFYAAMGWVPGYSTVMLSDNAHPSAADNSSGFRLYNGETYPLLRAFMTPLNVTLTGSVAYDGSGAPLNSIAGLNGPVLLPAGTDTSLLQGSGASMGTTLTLSNAVSGSYTATANGLYADYYSGQFGYDIISYGPTSASRTIATPGSAAGEVQLPSNITWNSGNLNIDTSGAITTVGARGQNTTAIIGGAASTFTLSNGTWTQDAATLPSFSAGDFQLKGGTYLRALGGDGSVGAPWQLTDIYGVQGMATRLNGNFALANDIDGSGTYNWAPRYYVSEGFVPIGNASTPFTGSLNGQNHTIAGLNINRPATDYLGLFGMAASATLSNFGITNVYINGETYAGGVMGYGDAGTSVSNVHVSGTMDVSNSDNGGLAGYSAGSIDGSDASVAVNMYLPDSISGGPNLSSNAVFTISVGGLVGVSAGTVSNSHATGTVSSGASLSSMHPNLVPFDGGAGGLIGYMSGASVTNCYATGNVSGWNNKQGGLIGASSGANISGSYATGNVTATQQGTTGGLVGVFDNGTISSSYATGTVTGTGSVGGLVGSSTGAVSDSYATGAVINNASGLVPLGAGGLIGWTTASVNNSYATGDVSGLDQYLGGLVGYSDGADVINSFASGSVTGTVAGTTVGGLVGSVNNATVGFAYATGALTAPGGTVGGLLGTATNSAVDYSYATSPVSTGYTTGGGLVGNLVSGLLTANFWNTDSGFAQGVGVDGTGAVTTTSADGRTLTDLTKLATFTPAWGPYRITDTGGDVCRWRIYDGQTTPLLRSFLTPLTVTADSGSRQYDGTTAGLGVSYSTTPDSSLLLGTVSTTVPGSNVGHYTITPSGLYSSQLGYDISFASGTLDIIPRTVSITGATVANKTYDGTTLATLTNAGTLSGLVGNETLTLGTSSLVADFADKNAGTGKVVTVSGYTLADGTGLASNYILPGDAATATADITPAILSISGTTASNKTYDGTTVANINVGTLSGLVGGETLGVTAAGTFDSKNVGSRTAIASYTLLNGSGLASNYSLADTSGLAASINPATLTLSSSNVTKTYDGTTSAAGTAVVTVGTLYGTDTLNGGNFAFTDKNAGTNKTVAVSGITVNDGNGGNNYEVSYVDNTTSTISPKTLFVAANDVSKAYDGLPYEGGNGVHYTGFVPGEDASVLNQTLSYSGSSQGAENIGFYAISPGGLSARNYNLVFVDGRLTITPSGLSAVNSSLSSQVSGQASRQTAGQTAAGSMSDENTDLNCLIGAGHMSDLNCQVGAGDSLRKTQLITVAQQHVPDPFTVNDTGRP